MAKDLLYKPNLGYTKNYYTEGYVDSSNEEVSTVNKNEQITSEQLTQNNIQELNNSIKNKLSLIPNDILNVFMPPYITVNDIINSLDDEIAKLPKKEKEEWDVNPDVSPEVNPDNNPNDYISDPFGSIPDDIDIIIPPKEPEDQEQQRQFIKDVQDIIYDYLSQFNSVINKYNQSVLTYHTFSDHQTLKMITTKTLKDKNLSHVADYIVKSNIALKQRLKLFSKLYTIDKSIYHFRAIKVANEQIKRYKTNNMIQNKNVLTKMSNGILQESILIAEKKYEENFYSLYKYLNSSVILLDECTNIAVKQKSALILLNNEERGN